MKQIPNSEIKKAEEMIRTGATYKEIKNKTMIKSDGLIKKIKDGKVNSNRADVGNDVDIRIKKIEMQNNKLSISNDMKDERINELEKEIIVLQKKISDLKTELNNKNIDENCDKCDDDSICDKKVDVKSGGKISSNKGFGSKMNLFG